MIKVILASVFIGLSPYCGVSVQASSTAPELQEVDSKESILNFSGPIEGMMVGGIPTVNGLKEIKALGLKTIISLVSKEEDETKLGFDEPHEASKLGLHYVRIPIAGKPSLTPENVKLFDAAIIGANGSAFVHCTSSNRVGAMFALRAFQLYAVSMKDALHLGKTAGLTSEKFTKVVKDVMMEHENFSTPQKIVTPQE
ncbi:MAG: hypothetical protein KUG56_02635 [Kordiimonadaceae bacterium]|nr:hypothetical protein [Kordiimonadaceae bacterium]